MCGSIGMIISLEVGVHLGGVAGVKWARGWMVFVCESEAFELARAVKCVDSRMDELWHKRVEARKTIVLRFNSKEGLQPPFERA